MPQRIEKIYPVKVTLTCPKCNINLICYNPDLPNKVHTCSECGYETTSNKVYPCVAYLTKEEYDKLS
jgi:hypothetical protein